eukprot:c30702_g1_i1 orf=224-550(+)
MPDEPCEDACSIGTLEDEEAPIGEEIERHHLHSLRRTREHSDCVVRVCWDLEYRRGHHEDDGPRENGDIRTNSHMKSCRMTRSHLKKSHEAVIKEDLHIEELLTHIHG